MQATIHPTRIWIFRVLSLFLVTGLIISSIGAPMREVSAADGSTASYLVQAGSAEQAAQIVEAYGGTVTSTLDIINGVGALLTQAEADQLKSAPGVKAVTLNATVDLVCKGPDDEEGGLGRTSPETDYPDVVGADVVWQSGIVGKNVAVAVLDTGISRHRGIYRDWYNRLGRVVAWKDFIDKFRFPMDPNGHGTHIAGIISNSQKGADKEWNGVAPGVNIVAVRVLDENGQGTYETVINGLQWVLKYAKRYNIRVINLSLVSPVQSAYWADPLNQAITRAWAEGLTVVAAAGNGGSNPMSIGVPGNNPYVITVGAFTDNYTPNDWNDDYITPFSAAGPTLDGFAKPDLVAPGAHIVSTMMPYSVVAQSHQANRISNQYFSMAGTSQAAAVVSGVAGLILSNNRNLTPNQVKFRLMETAFPWVDPVTTEAGYSIWQQGAGRVNAVDAVTANVQGEANGGMDIWADLNGDTHYEGYSYYDSETGQFKLRGEFESWAGGYGAWSGGYGAWSGGYGAWSGGYGAWSGGYGAWSGGYGAWSGGYGAWSGGYGAWSGGYGAWSGGYGAWSGGYGAWSGSEPWAGSTYSDAAFVEEYLSGEPLDSSTATTSVNYWVDEP